MWKEKLEEWVQRYGLPLVLATVAAIISANLVKALTGSNVWAGFIATWADNAVFYGYIAVRDLKKEKISGFSAAVRAFFKLIRNMLIEFGPAEYLDSFVIRPLYLSVFPSFIDNYSLAIFVGSMVAEITYFAPTIIAYETRKKAFKE